MNIKKKPIVYSRCGIDFVEVAPSKLKKELFCEYCHLFLTCEKLKDPDYPEDPECSFNDFCLRAPLRKYGNIENPTSEEILEFDLYRFPALFPGMTEEELVEKIGYIDEKNNRRSSL